MLLLGGLRGRCNVAALLAVRDTKNDVIGNLGANPVRTVGGLGLGEAAHLRVKGLNFLDTNIAQCKGYDARRETED